MHSLDRRTAIKTAGLAFGGTIWTPAFSAAQTAPPPKPFNGFIPPSISFSTELGSWTDHRVGQSLGHSLRGGHGTKEHYHNAGSAMRLMANHFSASGIDLAVKVAARKTDLSKVDFHQHATRSTVLQQLQQYVPHLHDSDLNESFPTDPDTIQSLQRKIAKRGISHHYHVTADVLHAVGHLMPKAKKVRPHLTAHVLHPTHAPLYMPASYHLEPAWVAGEAFDSLDLSSLGAACKKALCKLLSNPMVNDAVAGAIGFAIGMIEDLGVTLFCALDAASSLLADFLSEGWGIMLEPLELELCAGAKAGAKWYQAAVGISAGVAAGLLIRKLQSELGCPAGA